MRNNDKNSKLISDLRVLVVEDMSFDRELAVAVLKKMGIGHIRTAENGSIAISKIENSMALMAPFDLVITDWKMPVEDGHGLLKWIKTRQKYKAHGMKVIITTSLLDENDVKEFIQQGADSFIVKPLSLDVLTKKIHEVFVLDQQKAG